MSRTLSNITGIKPDLREAKNVDSIICSNRKIGIEIEVEGVAKGRGCSNYTYLQFESDGSLRNNGLEVKTLPVKGSHILAALSEFDSWKKAYNNTYSCSDRAGLHVHVDLRDASIKQLVNLLTTYLVVERCLYRYCGTERMYNPYCTPLFNDIHNSTNTMLKNLYSRSDSNVLDALHMHKKYTGLNFKPLLSLGTIEFRMHKGTHDTKEILEWVNVVLSLVNFSMEYLGNPQNIIDSVCDDADSLLEHVFNNTLNIPYDELYDDLLLGARAAQELYRSNDFIDTEDSIFHKLYLSSTRKPATKKAPPKPTGYSYSPYVSIDELL